MYCGQCGVKILGWARYCDQCGSSLWRAEAEAVESITEGEAARQRYLIGAACLTAAGLLLALAFAFGPSRGFTGNHVPDVTDLTTECAQATLQAAGLTCEFARAETSVAVAQGLVLRQRPQPASELPDDRTVALVVSLGPGVAVPDVIGMRQAGAVVTVERSGLIARVTGYGTSVGIPRGSVIDTEPPPGTSAPPGSTIGLVVSGGRPPGVPALAGMSGGEAKRVLRAMGMAYVIGGKRFSSSIPRGCVVGQRPAGGSDRPADGRVCVVLSLGRGVAMPDLSGLNDAGAHRALERVGLRVKVKRRYSETPAGTVMGWVPGAGSKLPSGGVATLVLSAGPEPRVVGDGFLRVETAPAELDVWVYVDGEGPLGKTPATLRMPAGSHKLVLYAPDRGGRDNIHVAVRPGETVFIQRSLR